VPSKTLASFIVLVWFSRIRLKFLPSTVIWCCGSVYWGIALKTSRLRRSAGTERRSEVNVYRFEVICIISWSFKVH
jgi:hypothetical protein